MATTPHNKGGRKATDVRDEPRTASDRKLERLKRSVLIAELVKKSGVVLEPQGELFLGTCPYHDDQDTSLVLNTRHNTWRCEPCAIGGDVLDWLRKRDALDYLDALEALKDMVRRGEATTPTSVEPQAVEGADRRAISPSLAAELHATKATGPWSSRMPTEEIDRLKRDISVVRLVEAQGVKLSGHGDNLVGLCPLHDDKNPSLVVSPSKNVWHCFGACRAGGSVIDWVMRAKKVSFRLAVEMLRQEATGLVAPVPATRPRLEPIAQPSEVDRVVLQRVVDFYCATGKESPEFLAFLERRGLMHSEVIDTFKLGYANRTLGYRLPHRQVKSGEMLRSQLQRLGIYSATGHERLAGSLTIPVFAEDGELLELYGRKISDDLRKGTPLHLYLPARADGRRGVFNLRAVKASKEIILCEALIDALTFWCAGFRNVTSAYGVEGFTTELHDALLEHNVRRVLIAYDADEAGDRAAEKLAQQLGPEGLEVFRVRFPKGMDANAYALAVKPAAKAFDTALRGAARMAGPQLVVVPAALEPITAPTPIAAASDDPIAGEPIQETLVSRESETTEPATPPAPGATPPDEATVAEVAVAPSPEGPSRAEQTPIASSEVPASPLVADSLPPRREPTESTRAALVEADVRDEEVRIRLGDRRWRIRGLEKATSYDSLHLNLLVARGDTFFVDNLELYSARARASFLKDAARELKVDEALLKADVARIVPKLEDLVHQRITKALELDDKGPEMTETERKEALELLQDPQLLERILQDFDKAGVVGETNNLIIGYLAAVSRKLERPLAVVIQSSSAAGKSSLMDVILRFVPEEDRVQYSAMTGQSLYYLGETDLEHKILAIAEEEGAQSASYALKLLQSEGELTIASTGKDPVTGRHVTHPYHVKGPVMLFMTTTAVEVDEELLNRCLVLTVDEGPKQTAAIHARQRELQTLEGLFRRRGRDTLVRRHQNAQRLLEPLAVVNPLAKSLFFTSHATRSRRDHMKYLTLIQCIALLHQRQRPIREAEQDGVRIRYVEVIEADIEIAKRLAAHVLDSTDELPPQTRRLLGLIQEMVKSEAEKQGVDPAEVRFSRKDIRTLTRWSDAALKKHLGRLEDLEHLVVHAGGARKRIVYTLAASPYDAHLVTPSGNWSPPGHPLVTPPGCSDNSSESGNKIDLSTPELDLRLRPAANHAHAVPSYEEARR